MIVNLLTGIYNIVQRHSTTVREENPTYNIRINNVGEKLEFFVKDALVGTSSTPNKETDNQYSEVYSWLGGQNNPPDLIIKNGDAFEVKKVESVRGGGSLALNSSHPKDKLYSDDTKITQACRDCEEKPWTTKDMYYVIGIVPPKEPINSILFVHGLCYVAKREIYENLFSNVKEKTQEDIMSLGYSCEDTLEIGRINRVDPLGITFLRIRGMWGIKNPYNVFKAYLNTPTDTTFSVFAILTKEKYESYPQESRLMVESEPRIKIENIELADPNNPAKKLPAKLICSYW
ncbi:MAG: NgoPII family restriction endonuclease [Paludibacter sp.]|nr:NgoPII family restriction endonuclease [Paludibacter sp.]MDD4429649.1 NgoPII family restriction endonuclease [Paludibacter sp.]